MHNNVCGHLYTLTTRAYPIETHKRRCQAAERSWRGGGGYTAKAGGGVSYFSTQIIKRPDLPVSGKVWLQKSPKNKKGNFSKDTSEKLQKQKRNLIMEFWAQLVLTQCVACGIV